MYYKIIEKSMFSLDYLDTVSCGKNPFINLEF